MIKRTITILLALILIAACLMGVPTAQAVTVSAYAPKPTVSYDYSSDVECGTIRYISQKTASSAYYSQYWGNWDADSECSTSCISMALSYVGINTTPRDILDYGNGLTYFGRDWGGSVSRIYTYQDLETAMNHYVNGEGKYSPPIVHLDKYSYAGHYVLLIGRISENEYQVLDPANTALWNMEINGSTATYSLSKGKVITDTIDEGGSDVYQWYNPSAKLPGYLSECTAEASYCGVKTTGDVAAMSLPCGSAVNSGSVQMEVIPKGTEVVATRLVMNTQGKYWYRIETPGGKTAFIPAGQTTYVESYSDDLKIHNAVSPQVLERGEAFSLQGTITAENNVMTRIYVEVTDKDYPEGDPVLSGEESLLSKAYFLKGSFVDKKMPFAQLPTGEYTYSIYADYSNAHATSETTKEEVSGTLCLYSADFKVEYAPVECTHSYKDEITTQPGCLTNGVRTFTCTGCQITYTDLVAPVGHKWEAATCSAPKHCAGCERTEGETLPHTWAEATCTLPKTCSVCAVTEGAAKGHSFAAGVCSVCKEKDPNYTPVKRVAGNTRYETALKAADEYKSLTKSEAFSVVIVASGENFADALAGSYLASVKGAPILLVKDSTVAAVKDYIAKNLTPGGTVYLLGGEQAVPKSMEAGLENFTIKRLGGKNRYDTNLLILEEAGVEGKDVVVCTGKDFADSLSASAVGLPILLVKDALSDSQNAFIQETGGKKIIIGGKKAVSEKVESQLAAYGTVERLAGNNRYETSVLVAKKFFPAAKQAVLAYGGNFPDGLSGGPVACAIGAPMVLTKAGSESVAAKYCADTGITTGYAMGGTKALPEKTIKQVMNIQ